MTGKRKSTKKRSGKSRKIRRLTPGESFRVWIHQLARDAKRRYADENLDLESARVRTRITTAGKRNVKALYAFFTFRFVDSFPISLAPELFAPARAALRRKFRGLTILKCAVVRRGEEAWRSISATVSFDGAFQQISFNTSKWIERDEYDSIVAVEIKTRVPRKIEKILLGEKK